jgi:hypothetical protein
VSVGRGARLFIRKIDGMIVRYSPLYYRRYTKMRVIASDLPMDPFHLTPASPVDQAIMTMTRKQEEEEGRRRRRKTHFRHTKTQ